VIAVSQFPPNLTVFGNFNVYLVSIRMYLFLISFSSSLTPRLIEISLGPLESQTVPLSSHDAFFLNSFIPNPSVEFSQDPALPKPIALTPGSGYAFRGNSLTLRSLSSERQSLSLWLIPNNVCLFNNFIVIPLHFSLVFKAEPFSQFCLFSPLNLSDAIFQFASEKRTGTIIVSDGEFAQEISDHQLVRFNRPFVIYNSKPKEDVGRFQFEMESVGQWTCEMKRIVDTTETEFEGKWIEISPSCVGLQDPAFSLPVACVLTTIVAIAVVVLFQKWGWIDVPKLLGIGEAVPEIETEPRVEDHLDVREIENPPQQPEEQQNQP
jgi:hypothetical protein